jgi:hypothetical protein
MAMGSVSISGESMTVPHDLDAWLSPRFYSTFITPDRATPQPGWVAVDLGMSIVAVCQAKSRVLRRRRQERDGPIESSHPPPRIGKK